MIMIINNSRYIHFKTSKFWVLDSAFLDFSVNCGHISCNCMLRSGIDAGSSGVSLRGRQLLAFVCPVDIRQLRHRSVISRASFAVNGG